MDHHFTLPHPIAFVLVLGLCLFSSLLLAQDSQPGSPSSISNLKIKSFNQAKKLLHNAVFTDHMTYYCGCRYDDKKKIDLSTCGYKPKTTSARAMRVEWDHVVPAESFGHAFKEWRDGHPDCTDKKGKPFKGRKCASKTNPTFQLMQSDLYNLIPAEGEINGLRENFSFSVIPGETWEFGDCKIKIQDRKIEPRPEICGDIARIYMYMDKAYPGFGIISKKNKNLFEAWSREDPVGADECWRVRKIEKLQGNRNSIVDELCKAAGLP